MADGEQGYPPLMEAVSDPKTGKMTRPWSLYVQGVNQYVSVIQQITALGGAQGARGEAGAPGAAADSEILQRLTEGLARLVMAQRLIAGVYVLGTANDELVQSAVADVWVPVNAVQVQIDTDRRGSLTAHVITRMRALDAGVRVQARLYDVTRGAPCPGLSDFVISQDWSDPQVFEVTLTEGAHFYRPEILLSAANSDAGFVGYLE